ncbi:MAG: helix-turn-helix domain-containing protein [Candidatus Thorarchaeota archaeon]
MNIKQTKINSKQNLMTRDFKGIWIPREIWLRQDLSIQAKALWAEIYSLHDREKGGCYASQEYFMEFLGLKLSRLKEILKELKDKELLKRASFDGRERILTAIMPPIDYGDRPADGRNTGQQTAGIPASPIYNKDIDKSIEQRERKDPATLPPSKNILPKKKPKKLKLSEYPRIQRRSKVFTSDEEHNKLLEHYAEDIKIYGKDLIDLAYDAINYHQEMKGMKYANDYAALRQWGIDGAKEKIKRREKLKDEKDDQQRIFENKRIATKIKEEFEKNYKNKNHKIEVMNTYLEIYQTVGCGKSFTIPYKEHGFLEQVKNALRKRGYTVK